MKILFIGDVVGRPGRALVRKSLNTLVRAHGIHFVVVNAENAAAGAGITREIATDLLKDGAHVLTSGNHVWDKREVLTFIDDEPRLLRPANYPLGAPGRGSTIARASNGVDVGVINIMGRVFLANIDDPFTSALVEIERLRQAGARVIFVDFHAETTSEKIAMGWHLDGKVTALIGTHTHVQTADGRVLPEGTAYLTDAGMTGPHDGVIGMDRSAVLARFLTGMPARFEPATGDVRLHGVVIGADETTGRATSIETLSLTADELERMSHHVAGGEAVGSRP
ncbi:MAG: TIGR00282 family metallophosphoesterase [Acidobacteria bacterium]|nr:TIGR00282 family metallophosphoesterase [Acidobacteriota bacterium]